jgi:hypothetical protein
MTWSRPPWPIVPVACRPHVAEIGKAELWIKRGAVLHYDSSLSNQQNGGQAPHGGHLFNRYTLRQVSRFVDVTAAQHRAMIGKKLQRHDRENRHQQIMVHGNLDEVIHNGPEFGVAGIGDGNN